MSIRFEKINVEHGLSQSTVYQLHQDKSGFIWIGTQDGLNLYNGKTFHVYRHRPFDQNSISHNSIRKIFEDNDSGIWVVTSSDQLNYIKRNSELVQNHFYNHNNAVPDAIRDINSNTFLFTNRNNFIFAASTKYGYYLFDTRDRSYHFSKIDSNIQIISAVNDSKKNIWLLSKTGKVFKLFWEKKKFRTHEVDFMLKEQPFLIFYSNNHLILSSENYIYQYSEESKTLKKLAIKSQYISKEYEYKRRANFYKEISGERLIYKNDNYNLVLLSNSASDFHHIKKINTGKSYVTGIVEDNEKNLWFTTSGDGLVLFNKKLENKRFLKKNSLDPYSLSNNLVTSILKDESGIVWVGTGGAGINKYDYRRQKFEHLWYKSEEKFSEYFVWSLSLESKNKLWIGTRESGLLLYDIPTDKVIKQYKFQNSSVRAIYKDDENGLWIGNSYGLYLKNKKNKLIKFQYSESDPFSISSNRVHKIYKDSKRRIWIATSSGLNLYLGNGKFKSFTLDENNPYSISSNYVSDIAEYKGEIWLATHNGLNHLDKNLTKFSSYFHHSENKNSLSTNALLSIKADQEQLWIGTFGGGLNIFKPSSNRFEYFTQKDGLINDVVYEILKDKHGYIWLSTNQGISRFDPFTRQFRNYTGRDGLQSNEFNSGAAYQDEDGRLFFGGINGISMFYPEQVKDYPNTSPLVLTSFKSMNEERNWDDDFCNLKKIELSYNENFFSFQYSLLDYTNQDRVVYEYRLKNFEKKWNRSVGVSEASYTNVDAGFYLFQVRAANEDGQWGNLLEIQVKVFPPFWEETWFHLSILLLIIILVYTIHKYRMKKKIKHLLEIERIKAEENERIRRKTADDFHDEMGNKLTRISVLSDLITRKLNKGNFDIINQIRNIRENADNLYHGTRDFIWSIDPKNDSFYDLAIRVKDFGDDFFDNTDINFQVFGLNESFEKINLNIDKRRHLILIFKEAMTNILKHADARNVKLEFALVDDKIQIILSDDGKGFDLKEAEDVGNGLSNFKRRINKISGSLYLDSEIGKGSRIEYIDKEKKLVKEIA